MHSLKKVTANQKTTGNIANIQENVHTESKPEFKLAMRAEGTADFQPFKQLVVSMCASQAVSWGNQILYVHFPGDAKM